MTALSTRPDASLAQLGLADADLSTSLGLTTALLGAQAAAATIAPVRRIAPVTRGTFLGSVERRFGLLASLEPVAVRTVLERCVDLAVADRIAYLAAAAETGQHAVVGIDGYYWVVELEGEFTPRQLASMHVAPEAPRLLSVATSHGIVPQL